MAWSSALCVVRIMMLTLLVLLFDGRPDLPRAYSRLVFDLLSVCSKARLARSSGTYML